ncbi:MAG: SUMF1/EgtB/PvdO family nonheme iron enzyme [Pyrinomonadaceae bacterium]
MIGNVSEWTTSTASLYPGNTRPVRVPDLEKGRIVQRGGSYLSKPKGERAINALRRGWNPASMKNPSFGFRLARDGA